jgi:hypothetical protein
MFSRKIIKDKGVVRLYFSDPFNTIREKEVSDYNNTHIDFFQKRPTRTMSLSFSYNFKLGKKFNQRNIDQSKNEERTRMGN